MVTKTKGMGELFKEVIDKGLCTLCGACIGDCPYTVFYRGKIRMLDFCTREEGHCYEYCPRTSTDLDAISNNIFGVPFSGAEIGTVKDVFMARSKDAKVRSGAQYGGTVTSLLLLAMESGLVDAAITTKTGEDRLPAASVAHSAAEVMAGAGSSYMAYPVLEALNRTPRDSKDSLGIVVTPCQAIALAKMRLGPPMQRANLDNVRFSIGLFCTWALAYDRFYEFLKNNVDLPKVKKFDIPPPPANRFDVYIGKEVKSFPLDDVRNYRMPTCAYCLDMTAEFTDISVGSVEGVDGWNTVIVRTQRGAELIAEAKKKGKLEIKDLPALNLVHLKEAALNKKARAVQEIVKKTGHKNDLMYLGIADSLKNKLLGHRVSVQGGH
ncbi:MAG: Coenzyme F420 hydrogenase/dehydrogenase, beta subunit C-terminal domain [Chloroflexi bacterium]|nr:Coenzyme F420 hydrogenase/dehydrogenase, beta subunit C-terminal domain [Chloroflexota bacterium]